MAAAVSSGYTLRNVSFENWLQNFSLGWFVIRLLAALAISGIGGYLWGQWMWKTVIERELRAEDPQPEEVESPN